MKTSRHRSDACDAQGPLFRGDVAVGQVIGSFGGGGAQRLAYNVAVGVGDRGVRSLAVALREVGNWAHEQDPRVRSVALCAKSAGPLGMLRALLRFRSIVRSERVGLLHVHGTGSLPFVVLATLGLPGVRIAFTWQDSERVLHQRGWRRRLMVWALRRCASVSGSCRKVAEKLRAGAGLADVGIFHGGVPATPEPSRRPDAERPGIIWIGRMVPPKDPQALVRAAATLRDEGFHFSVDLVGRPIPSTQWYFEQTKELVAQLGLSDTVRAPGFLDDEAMRTLSARSQIAVQTSHTEGLSIALLEQMMAGMAIVATDVGDTSCAIRDGENGLLVPPHDQKALEAALRRLLGDPALRRRLGRAARESALSTYSLEAVADRALREYERLVAA
ncbi:MAG: glycosyltransferase family 4 protein [Phycisphaerae bacterium]|jgi:glycosyltransferase involved in cell wall biosynthesis